MNPQWGDWQATSNTNSVSAVVNTGFRAPSRVLNTQKSTQQRLVKKEANVEPLPIAYGETWCSAPPDFWEESGGYYYFRSPVCIGEIESIDEVKINDTSYATGDYSGDLDFKGDFTAWADLQILPVDLVGGWIFTKYSKTYRVKETVTITANIDSYSPHISSYHYEYLVTGVSINTYTGTQVQGIDPLLLEVDVLYDETLILNSDHAVAYIVGKIPISSYQGGWPNISCLVQGMKVRNPDTGLKEYSNNASLCMADLIASDMYGLGYPVDDTSLIIARDYTNEIVNGEKRSEYNYVLDSRKKTTEWIDIIRTYAYVFLDWQESVVFILDKPNTASHTLKINPQVNADILASKPTRKWISRDNRPNRVRVSFTDPANNYNQSSVVVESQAFIDSDETERFTGLNMPSFSHESQALIFANLRLNAAINENWESTFDAYDYGVEINAGDVIAVELKNDNQTSEVRVRKIDTTRNGRYRISARQYKEEVYL